MILKDALKWGIETLEKAGVETQVLDAEVLLVEAPYSPIRTNRRIDRSWLFAHLEKIVSSATLTRYEKFIARRVKREPVAYIVGRKEFYGLDFVVNRNVLIPRPETELIVERVNYEIAKLRNYERRNLTIVDVGTGSGAIVVVIAKECKMKNVKCKMFATDISAVALRVARQNARLNGVGTLSVPKTPLSGVEKKIKFLKGNLLEPVLSNMYDRTNLTTKKWIITANLPYLPTAEWRGTMPEVRKWEPRGALDGGRDGFKYYREIFGQLYRHNSPQPSLNLREGDRKRVPPLRVRGGQGALRATILCEICPEQAVSFKKLVRGYFPKAQCEVVKDLAGNNRIVVVTI